MKKFKRAVALFLLCVFVLSLCACGEKKASPNSPEKTAQKEENGATVWYLGSIQKEPEKLFADIADPIDPAALYRSVTYTEDMFYGVYTLNDEEADLKKTAESLSSHDVEFADKTHTVSSLPVKIYMGKDFVSTGKTGYRFSAYKDVTDYEVAVLTFAEGDKTPSVACAYTVSGNKIHFTEVKGSGLISGISGAADQEGKAEFEFEFEFCGPYLTLKSGSESVKLISYCFSKNNTHDLELRGYSLPDSPLIDELDYFYARKGLLNYAVKRDGHYYKDHEFKLSDDGTFSAYLLDRNDDRVFLHQYIYFAQSTNSLLDNFSIVLYDGTTKYYYTDSITRREARILAEDIPSDSELTEDQLKDIAEKKEDLFEELQNEFEAKGISVTVNRVSGELALDANVLFGGDSSEITADGKDLLKNFASVYSSVIAQEKYQGFIQKTVIEGHTAPLEGSTYESGLPLSQERADKVRDYLATEAGMDASTLEAVGRSNSKPVYDSTGQVDIPACRRVSFRFAVNVPE